MSRGPGRGAVLAAPVFAAMGGVVRAALSLAVTLLGLLFVTFFIGRVMPIDPVLAVVGERASPETYAAAYRDLGLDQPLAVQFFRYLGDVARGDLGTSLLTARPVAEDIARVFPATLELATLGTLIGVALGVPDADLVAGDDGASAVLRHAGLGRWAGAAGRGL